jgi:hypothetical protein
MPRTSSATPTSYTYDSEDATDNLVLYYATDELMENQTLDPLRKELGFEINIYRPESDSESPQFQVSSGQFDIDIDPLRDQNFVQMKTYSPYIEKMEINASRIVPLSTKALLPNYSIPVRLYANEQTTKGDKFWRTLFTGGEFAGDTYAPLINTTNIFNEYFFSFANSYSTLYAKSIGTSKTSKNIYQLSSVYNSHNINVKEYQEWSTTQGSPLLIPSYHLFETIREGGITQLSTPLRQYLAYTSSNNVFDISLESIDSSLEKIGENFTATTGKSYLESSYFPLLRAANINADIKNHAVISQRNYMFDAAYYAERTVEITMPDKFPYYNIIKFPRHESAGNIAPALGAEYDGLNKEKFFIRDAIESNNFSSKFLETLKDIHEKTWPSISFGSKPLTVEKSGLVLSKGTSYGTETKKNIYRKSYRTLDLIKMIQTIYNQPDASLNSNYTFIGPDSPGYHTTYQDNKLYRYYDNQNLVGALDDIYGDIKSKYQFPQTLYSWEPEGDEFREYATGGDFDTLDNTRDIMNFIFNPHICHSETIAYRIEKSGGETFGDYNTSNVIQDYWIFNSKEAEGTMEFFDTQVKYGQNYTYKCYAYVGVLGKRYKYSDFRLTTQIALLDQAEDGDGTGVHGLAASDGNIDYYCLQFYEPLSGEMSDQFFNDGTPRGTSQGALTRRAALNLESVAQSTESILRGNQDTSALSQRNQLSTNGQGLSMHPQLADFMFHVEPCIKLIEIPLFTKKIRMLDSPANDMIAIPFQYIDNSKRIGFNMRYESFNEMRPYPVSITKEDRQMHLDYLNSRDILPGEDVTERSVAQQRYIEVYRTDKKPTSFSDFEGKLVDTIDLKIEDSYYTFPDAIHTTKIPTNKKFYYVFRYVTENLVPGHMSQILECELVNDGNYIYSKFNVLFDELSEEDTLTEPTKTLKKMLQLEPNISQITLDTSEIDFLKTSRSQADNLIIGAPGIDLIWNKKFKIRLTSKKTGKQIDLNVEYALKKEDRINIESGNAANAILQGESADEFNTRLGFLAGIEPGSIASVRPGVDILAMSFDGMTYFDAFSMEEI